MYGIKNLIGSYVLLISSNSEQTCCYIKTNKEDFSILVVWVDDFLALSTKEHLNDDIECNLNIHFKVKSLGQPSLLLGIKINIGGDKE